MHLLQLDPKLALEVLTKYSGNVPAAAEAIADIGDMGWTTKVKRGANNAGKDSSQNTANAAKSVQEPAVDAVQRDHLQL